MLIKNDFEVAQPVEQGLAVLRRHPAGGGLPARRGADRRPRRRQVPGQGGRPDGPGPAAVRRHRRHHRARRSGQAHRRARERCRREGPRPGQHARHRDADAGGPRHEGRRDPGPAALRCGGAVRPGHDLRRHRRADARLLGQPAGPDRADRARRVAEQSPQPPAPGQGLHARPAGRADGAEPGLPPLLPALPGPTS